MTDALTLFDGTAAADDPELVATLTDARPYVASHLAELESWVAMRPHDREIAARAARYRACLTEIDQILETGDT